MGVVWSTLPTTAETLGSGEGGSAGHVGEALRATASIFATCAAKFCPCLAAMAKGWGQAGG